MAEVLEMPRRPIGLRPNDKVNERCAMPTVTRCVRHDAHAAHDLRIARSSNPGGHFACLYMTPSSKG